MAKKTSLYARALVESLKDASANEQKKRIMRFKNLLKKRGDLRLLSAILGEFSKLWGKRDGKIAKVISAQKSSASFLDLVKKTLKKEGYVIKDEVHADLIGGAAVFLSNEYLIDNSIKGKLHKLRLLMKA